MPRPHIDFIQPQHLPWEKGLPGGARPEVESKLLSIDATAGDSSLIVRHPAGWRATAAHHLDVDEEFFVLEGAIEINGICYERGCYAHLPKGFTRWKSESPQGCVALTFFSGRPKIMPGEPAGRHDALRVVPFVDTKKGGWQENTYFPGRVLFLRIDPYTRDMTYLQTTRPNDGAGKVETHDTVQEFYVLAGELSTPLGLYEPGAYIWRPPLIKHGPFGTQTGCNFLLRSVGGPLTYQYYPVEKPFTWTPAHTPILPPELQKYGGALKPGPNY